MKITRNQASMLADLTIQIQQHYGFNIGYLNPTINLPMDPSVDFLIFENPAEGEDTLQCFHRDDLQDRIQGNIVVRTISSEPEHDAKVEELFKRLNDDLFAGVLSFDPGVTREVDGVVVSVTKKEFPNISMNVFETNIFTEKFGVVYTYPIICEHAKIDKKFKIAKDIIDELWPQSEPKPEPEKPKTNWLDHFKKWFL